MHPMLVFILSAWIGGASTEILFEAVTNWNWDLFEYDIAWKLLWVVLVVIVAGHWEERLSRWFPHEKDL